ncbi:uncharacterized protein J5F26_011052 isoform 1-T1 [Ciconia maguari]
MATGSLCAVELQFELLSSVDFFQREGKMKFVDGIFTTNSEFVAQWTLDSSLQGYRIQSWNDSHMSCPWIQGEEISTSLSTSPPQEAVESNEVALQSLFLQTRQTQSP